MSLACNKHCGKFDEPAHPEDCEKCQLERVEQRLAHALAALRHIARTCIEDPDTAAFACAASNNPPGAFAPKEDYDEETP